MILTAELTQLLKTSLKTPEERRAIHMTSRSSSRTLRIANLIRQQTIKFTSQEIAARARVKPAVVQSIINRMKENGELEARGSIPIRRGRVNLWAVVK
jgi:GTPase Era involved in 16S rRNA processing